ncbi:MAG: hypothetical protein J5725_08720 [Bacteroidales bacterium]|nr:hypothetical protein [Bacteroidales bacterium]
MSDTITVNYSNISDIDVGTPISGISKVILVLSDGTSIETGDDTGLSIEINVPFGNAAMAENILSCLQNNVYQPFTAQGAIFDPAVELGDAVVIGDVVSNIFTQTLTFDGQLASEISAPSQEEVDNEYKFETSQNRTYDRMLKDVGSKITQTVTDISAEVKARQDGDEYVSSLIQQTASDLLLSFQNELRDYKAYIRFTTDPNTGLPNIILGAESSDFTVIITNEKISFMQGNTEVAYVANNQFFTPHQVVQNELDLGGYQLDATDGIAFRWKGRG